jgi:hypothetical protein
MFTALCIFLGNVGSAVGESARDLVTPGNPKIISVIYKNSVATSQKTPNYTIFFYTIEF